MAAIQVSGRIGSVNTAGTLYVLWEKKTLPNGMELKFMWRIFGTSALGLGEGDIVTIRGEYSSAPSEDINGQIGTYTDKKGRQITKTDLFINNPEVLEHKPSETKTYESAGIDGDDVRKYGHPTYGNEQPF